MLHACYVIAAVCFLCEAELKRQRHIHSSSNIHVLPIVERFGADGTSFLAAQSCLYSIIEESERAEGYISKQRKGDQGTKHLVRVHKVNTRLQSHV